MAHWRDWVDSSLFMRCMLDAAPIHIVHKLTASDLSVNANVRLLDGHVDSHHRGMPYGWLIEVPEGKYIKVEFVHLNLGAGEQVKVYNGMVASTSTLIGSWHHSEDVPDRTASLEDTFLDWDFLALHVLPLLEAPGGAGDSIF